MQRIWRNFRTTVLFLNHEFPLLENPSGTLWKMWGKKRREKNLIVFSALPVLRIVTFDMPFKASGRQSHKQLLTLL